MTAQLLQKLSEIKDLKRLVEATVTELGQSLEAEYAQILLTNPLNANSSIIFEAYTGKNPTAQNENGGSKNARLSLALDIDGRGFGTVILSRNKIWSSEEIDETRILAGKISEFIRQAQLNDIAQRETFKKTFLVEINSLMTYSLGAGDALFMVVNILGKALRSSRCLFICTDDKNTSWKCYEYWQQDKVKSCQESHWPTNNSAIMGQALTSHTPLRLYEGQESSYLTPVQTELKLMNAKSLLALPLISKNQIYGCIVIQQCDYRRNWTVSEMDTVQSIADKVADALANLPEEKRIHKPIMQLHQRIISETTEATDSLVQSLKEALEQEVNVPEEEKIIEEVAKVTQEAAAAAILVVDNDGKQITVKPVESKAFGKQVPSGGKSLISTLFGRRKSDTAENKQASGFNRRPSIMPVTRKNRIGDRDSTRRFVGNEPVEEPNLPAALIPAQNGIEFVSPEQSETKESSNTKIPAAEDLVEHVIIEQTEIEQLIAAPLITEQATTAQIISGEILNQDIVDEGNVTSEIAAIESLINEIALNEITTEEASDETVREVAAEQIIAESSVAEQTSEKQSFTEEHNNLPGIQAVEAKEGEWAELNTIPTPSVGPAMPGLHQSMLPKARAQQKGLESPLKSSLKKKKDKNNGLKAEKNIEGTSDEISPESMPPTMPEVVPGEGLETLESSLVENDAQAKERLEKILQNSPDEQTSSQYIFALNNIDVPTRGRINGWVEAIEQKDKYLEPHAIRVAEYASAIAKALKLPEDEIETIRLAALVHDVGKLGISADILQKPDSELDDIELLTKMRHPIDGAELLNASPSLAHLAPFVLAHHEEFNGNGYPEGLQGEDIPLASRILHLANSYHNLVSKTRLSDGLSPAEAKKIIRKGSGKEYDPKLVRAFLKVLNA